MFLLFKAFGNVNFAWCIRVLLGHANIHNILIRVVQLQVIYSDIIFSLAQMQHKSNTLLCAPFFSVDIQCANIKSF